MNPHGSTIYNGRENSLSFRRFSRNDCSTFPVDIERDRPEPIALSKSSGNPTIGLNVLSLTHIVRISSNHLKKALLKNLLIVCHFEKLGYNCLNKVTKFLIRDFQNKKLTLLCGGCVGT